MDSLKSVAGGVSGGKGLDNPAFNNSAEHTGPNQHSGPAQKMNMNNNNMNMHDNNDDMDMMDKGLKTASNKTDMRMSNKPPGTHNSDTMTSNMVSPHYTPSHYVRSSTSSSHGYPRNNSTTSTGASSSSSSSTSASASRRDSGCISRDGLSGAFEEIAKNPQGLYFERMEFKPGRGWEWSSDVPGLRR